MEDKINEVAIEYCLFMEIDPYEETITGELVYETYKKKAIEQLAWFAAITKAINLDPRGLKYED